ncbi:triosephosphate isomerase [Brachybacterium muris]|uniref:triose-phosphate isomerase n=1 Tax=Brachybacterium muris TaxID=219301 RepID=UPI0019563494|nr:triosephosphate isomerase [Brachybacterium muris]MCT1429172.1 triose-phosphate isomerase [Brachybacterium muris]MCT2176347.1 triose-phosphate isomerase [Brachybacterium muris]MCT2261625.1 triose-phosphate isomerase [Brachybacterium muris]MCT2294625.1 triose-phosphate isomerase [Brachybacterium muris]
MTTRTPLMAGNWKMNLDWKQSLSLVEELGEALREVDTTVVEAAVLPPFVNIRTVQTAVEAGDLPISYGAQDISAHESGAYTGEISGSMLTALGCTYVVVGHSERREYHCEGEVETNAKVKAALSVGLSPILCVGEPLEERKAGKQVEYSLAQLEGGIEGLSAEDVAKVVVAYEPVWAIGTGEVATPDDAQEVCAAIRDLVRTKHGDATADALRVLYGGSVKSSNVAELMTKEDVDGALVGGASLKAEEFAKIVGYQDSNA